MHSFGGLLVHLEPYMEEIPIVEGAYHTGPKQGVHFFRFIFLFIVHIIVCKQIRNVDLVDVAIVVMLPWTETFTIVFDTRQFG